jgi:hypothetical protein
MNSAGVQEGEPGIADRDQPAVGIDRMERHRRQQEQPPELLLAAA